MVRRRRAAVLSEAAVAAIGPGRSRPGTWARIAGAAVLGAALVPACSPHAQAACEGLEPQTPAVTVEVTGPAEPEIVAASEAELRARAVATGRGMPAGAVTRGLTTAETEARASYTVTAITLADGTRCLTLQSLAGEVVERSAVILIDQRYRPGTCQHDALLAHEREHAEINAAALRQTADLLEERLKRVAGRWAGHWLADPGTHPADQEVDAAIAEVMRRAQEQAERRHRSIDSPASYAQVQARCAHW